METRFEFKEVEHPLDLYDTEIAIVDNETDNIISYDNACIVLNEQDDKIKELKETIKLLTKYNEQGQSIMQDNERLNKENQQLKQSQNSKAIEELEKVKGKIASHTLELWSCENDDIDFVLYEEIDNQITELIGGK